MRFLRNESIVVIGQRLYMCNLIGCSHFALALCHVTNVTRIRMFKVRLPFLAF